MLQRPAAVIHVCRLFSGLHCGPGVPLPASSLTLWVGTQITKLSQIKDHERLELLKEMGGTNVYEERRRASEKLLHEAEGRRLHIADMVCPAPRPQPCRLSFPCAPLSISLGLSCCPDPIRRGHRNQVQRLGRKLKGHAPSSTIASCHAIYATVGPRCDLCRSVMAQVSLAPLVSRAVGVMNTENACVAALDLRSALAWGCRWRAWGRSWQSLRQRGWSWTSTCRPTETAAPCSSPSGTPTSTRLGATSPRSAVPLCLPPYA